MQGIFYPRSVAVIGVSAKPDNLGRNIMLNLIDFSFDGVVYPVGPSGGTITTRRIYKSVLDIPDDVDMAVILVPARFVPQVLEECGQKGIRRVVIETAGFSELGPDGLRSYPKLAQALRDYMTDEVAEEAKRCLSLSAESAEADALSTVLEEWHGELDRVLKGQDMVVPGLVEQVDQGGQGG